MGVSLVDVGGVQVVVGVHWVVVVSALWVVVACCVVVGSDPPPASSLNHHVPYSTPTDSAAKKSKRPREKSRPPYGHPGH